MWASLLYVGVFISKNSIISLNFLVNRNPLELGRERFILHEYSSPKMNGLSLTEPKRELINMCIS